MLCHVRCWRSSRKKQSRSAARISSNNVAASLQRWSATRRRPRSSCRSRSRSLGNPMPPSPSSSTASAAPPSAFSAAASSTSSAIPWRALPTPEPTASRPPINTTAVHGQACADQTPLNCIGRIRRAPKKRRLNTPNHRPGPEVGPETVTFSIVSQPKNSAGPVLATWENSSEKALF